MDKTTEYLFGRFPRRVGNPNQWWVFGPGEMEAFLRESGGDYNLYATISWFHIGGTPLCDKVGYDFDSPLKESAFPGVESDEDRMSMMWEDPDLAQTVLGPVLRDVRALVAASEEDGIPVAGVFTGMGVHVYQLFEPREEPGEAMYSIARKYVEELELETADRKILGDDQRILRVPNQERVCKETGHPTGFYTVPLAPWEMAEWTPHKLIDTARLPRSRVTPMELDWPHMDAPRPEMEVIDDYRASKHTEASTGRPLEVSPDTYGPEWVRLMLKELIPLPCVYERLLQPNPDHYTRMNAAVLLYNTGLRPSEVENLFMALNWRDADRRTTRSQLEQIWRKGYADMSCETLQSLDLCVRTEAPEECPTFGWRGGRAEWRENGN